MKIKFIKDHYTETAIVNGNGERLAKSTTKRLSGIHSGKIIETKDLIWAKKMVADGFASFNLKSEHEETKVILPADDKEADAAISQDNVKQKK